VSSPALVRAEEAVRVATPLAAPNFDPLARLYRWMEWLSFGPYLSRCRRAFLTEITGASRALVLGDGDGRFTAALLDANRTVRVEALDASPAMLKQLRGRAGKHAEHLRTQMQDLRQWAPVPGAVYDLVATHFFLDCLSTEEILCLAESLRPHLAPGGQWVVSEFAIPPNWFGELLARPLIAFLYWAFRVMTGLTIRRLPDYHQALVHAGFVRVDKRRWLHGLLVSEIWTPVPKVGGIRS
jgi:SAM-dependent methyltransferase